MENKMRYYSEEELEILVKNFNDYWKTPYPGDNLPDITYDDLSRVALSSNTNKERKAVYFSTFRDMYALNIGDYFSEEKNVIGANETNTDDNKRFPIIVLYSDEEGNPDMFTLSEYKTLVENVDNEDLKVIYVDKMNKPMNKEYLDKISETENIAYDYSLYQ